MRFPAALLLLAACSTEIGYVCNTECGLLVYKLAGDWTCEKVQAVESVTREELSQTSDPRLRDICGSLSGKLVSFIDADEFYSPLVGGTVVGITNCDFGSLSVARAGSALPHELAHVGQACLPRGCSETNEDAAHACWDVDGIDVAVEHARMRSGI